MEEDLEKIKRFILLSKKTFGESTELAFAWRRIKDNIKELNDELKMEKMWRIRVEQENEDICNEVNTKYVRKSIAVPKYEIEKLKKENEIKIDKMRHFKHSSPFDFGVLNGIDECCRKLLEDK